MAVPQFLREGGPAPPRPFSERRSRGVTFPCHPLFFFRCSRSHFSDAAYQGSRRSLSERVLPRREQSQVATGPTIQRNRGLFAHPGP